MIGHVAPEAALGGPIALVEEGDEIVDRRRRARLDLEVAEADARRAGAPLDAARAALHRRRHGQVRGARRRRRARARSRTARQLRGRSRAARTDRHLTSRSDVPPDLVQDLAPGGSTGPTLDATWRHAGELGAFDARLDERPPHRHGPRPRGPSLEAMTMLAALVHHVPGKRVGHAVLSNTFRHPAVAREGRDGPRPRDRRPVHPRARRRLARGRARARSASRCRRSASGFDASSRAVRVIRGAVLADAAATTGRDAATTRSTRFAARRTCRRR